MKRYEDHLDDKKDCYLPFLSHLNPILEDDSDPYNHRTNELTYGTISPGPKALMVWMRKTNKNPAMTNDDRIITSVGDCFRNSTLKERVGCEYIVVEGGITCRYSVHDFLYSPVELTESKVSETIDLAKAKLFSKAVEITKPKILTETAVNIVHELLTGDVEKTVPVPEEDTITSDPNLMFKPSDSLVQLIIESSSNLEEDEEYEEDIEGIDNEDLKIAVSDQVEDYFANLARNAASFKQEQVVVSNKLHFDDEVSQDLVDRLGLTFYKSLPVLESLYKEFYNFISRSNRERFWGKYILLNKDIVLDIDIERAGVMPSF